VAHIPTVSVYRIKHPSTPWMVRFLSNGRRPRRYFQSQNDAEVYAAELRAKFGRFGTSHLELEPQQAAEYFAAREILPHGVGLVEAARFFVRHGGAAPIQRGPTLREAWVAFFESKARRSDGYQVQLSSQCEPLLDALGWDQRLGTIPSERLEAAIEKSNGVDETKANRRRMLFTFWKWAAGRWRLGENAMAHVKRWDVRRGTPKFHTRADVRRLLEAVCQLEPMLLPAVALRAFAGLRAVEVRRLVTLGLQGDIHVAERSITIRAEVAKAVGPEGRGAPRVIEDLPTRVWDWLGLGPLVWPADAAIRLRPCWQLAGVAPIKNGLRHAFCTHAAAYYSSLEKAAKNAGHDVDTMRKHYMGLVVRSAALRYFATGPAGWREP
jgi:hypothetical protein